MAGTRLSITGFVVTADCQSIPGARVDFWQADDHGKYDNSGYTLRGYTLTDANGRYTMATIVPGLYPGRTRHIHVKVGPSGGQTLTSQLYFPNEPANARDSIFDKRLIMDVKDAGSAREATFNFVIATP
jgi:protocatechuate 3,4-dioxygenase beta subunit